MALGVVGEVAQRPAELLGVAEHLSGADCGGVHLQALAAAEAPSLLEHEVVEVDGRVELCVVDDGPGIPPDARELVFERFTRLDDARSGGGAGLGLAIVREIVARHGGSVRVDDADGGGARVVVSLPVA